MYAPMVYDWIWREYAYEIHFLGDDYTIFLNLSLIDGLRNLGEGGSRTRFPGIQ